MPNPRPRPSAALLAAILALTACGDGGARDEAKLADALKRAKAHLATRNYDPALAAFDEVLAIDPEHVDARGLKAEILFNMARLDEAEAILVPLQRELGDHPGVTWLLAMVRKDQGRFEEALELFDKLPAERRPTLHVAEALTGVGRHDDAADLAGQALIEDPWNGQAYYVLSKIDVHRNRSEQAELWGQHYRNQESERIADRMARGLENKGQPLAAKLHRAKSSYDRGQWSDAMEIARGILRTNRRVAAAQVVLGRIYSDLGQSASAIRAFEQALEVEPDNGGTKRLLEREREVQQTAGPEPEGPVEMARRHVEQGDVEKARAAALFAAKQNPRNTDALRLVRQLFYRDEEAFVRLWALQRLIGLTPADVTLRTAWKEEVAKLGLRLEIATDAR